MQGGAKKTITRYITAILLLSTAVEILIKLHTFNIDESDLVSNEA